MRDGSCSLYTFEFRKCEGIDTAGKFPKLTSRRLSVQANTQCQNEAPRAGTMKKVMRF